MTTVAQEVPLLRAGDKLTQKEFLRRWEAMPEIKRAELIGGIVFMPSPTTKDHGIYEGSTATWLGYYAAFTPGCALGTNMTWLMLDDSPQPDVSLAILPDYGGQSFVKGKYCAGAPELAAEISHSSVAYDLHLKMDLYRRAGVLEYLAVLVEEQEVRWFHLKDGTYHRLPLIGGILRSRVFPGLWLNVAAFLAGRMKQVLATLQEGLDSPTHAKFVAQLARKRS